jgi:hypothetical protein
VVAPRRARVGRSCCINNLQLLKQRGTRDPCLFWHSRARAAVSFAEIPVTPAKDGNPRAHPFRLQRSRGQASRERWIPGGSLARIPPCAGECYVHAEWNFRFLILGLPASYPLSLIPYSPIPCPL